MSEFLTPGQLASLPVAVAVVTIFVNVIQRSFNINPSWMALAISMAYALLVFVWPIPAPAATAQEWAVRIVMAVIAAFMVAGGASDVSGRRAAREESAPTTRSAKDGPPLMRRWY
jgi:H+/gluconate symporter-like permease